MPADSGRGAGNTQPIFEECPALVAFMLFGTAMMHKVSARRLRLLRRLRMWIGVSDCGVMCFPQDVLDSDVVKSWCTKCFPFGAGWPYGGSQAGELPRAP